MSASPVSSLLESHAVPLGLGSKRPLPSTNPPGLDMVLGQIRARLFLKNIEMQLEEKKHKTYIIKPSANMEASDLKELLSDVKAEDWSIKISRKRSEASGDLRLRLKHQGISVTVCKTPPPSLMIISRTPPRDTDIVPLSLGQKPTFYVMTPEGARRLQQDKISKN